MLRSATVFLVATVSAVFFGFSENSDPLLILAIGFLLLFAFFLASGWRARVL